MGALSLAAMRFLRRNIDSYPRRRAKILHPSIIKMVPIGFLAPALVWMSPPRLRSCASTDHDAPPIAAHFHDFAAVLTESPAADITGWPLPPSRPHPFVAVRPRPPVHWPSRRGASQTGPSLFPWGSSRVLEATREIQPPYVVPSTAGPANVSRPAECLLGTRVPLLRETQHFDIAT